MFKKILLILMIFLNFTACNQQKLQISKLSIQNFEIHKFMGLWYEVAYIPNSFQNIHKNGQYEYFIDKNKHIILQKFLQTDSGKAVNSEDEINFIWTQKQGALEIQSFPKQIQNIVKIDANYQYAMIFGETTDELYILSRTKTLPEPIKMVYLNYAKSKEIDINKIIWTTQE